MRGGAAGRLLVALALVVLALVALAGSASAQPAAEDACAVPETILALDADLPQARERLESGLPLSILIVNSAKPNPKLMASGYPARLKEELAAQLRGARVEVTVLNLPGETAPGMIAPLLRAVNEQRPALVVWQTGTVDAMRSLDPEIFGNRLADGIAAVRRLGADLVIMDMQYSIHTAQLIDFAPYVTYIAWVSQMAGVFHFPRYDIMRHWVESGLVDFGSETEQAKQEAFDFVHHCIARLLAESVAAMVVPTGGRTQ